MVLVVELAAPPDIALPDPMLFWAVAGATARVAIAAPARRSLIIFGPFETGRSRPANRTVCASFRRGNHNRAYKFESFISRWRHEVRCALGTP